MRASVLIVVVAFTASVIIYLVRLEQIEQERTVGEPFPSHSAAEFGYADYVGGTNYPIITRHALETNSTHLFGSFGPPNTPTNFFRVNDNTITSSPFPLFPTKQKRP